jgi:hypothetical protein
MPEFQRWEREHKEEHSDKVFIPVYSKHDLNKVRGLSHWEMIVLDGFLVRDQSRLR